MTNAVYFVTVGQRRLLLRVYGVGCEQILDRDKELAWLSRLSQLNIGPALLATFENGRFEEYLDSTTLTRHDMRHAATSNQIASRLYQLHSIVNTFPPAHNEPLEVWQFIDKWYLALQNDVLALLIQKNPDWANTIQEHLNLSQLRTEIETCQSILLTSTDTVFAHNDTQYGNILKVNGTGELVVIDFEYAGYNPRGYDIANHFCEWMYDYHSQEPHTMNPENYPKAEEQMRFLSAYDSQHASELLPEVEKWKMACHLFWSLWGFVQASQSEIDFDYFTYSLQRLNAFRHELQKYA
ncbi:kinase-like domain-containing protein [Sporodiniella umbellata]|nr:kinase-like domain-containing protein [Sporodiniella umbellata]